MDCIKCICVQLRRCRPALPFECAEGESECDLLSISWTYWKDSGSPTVNRVHVNSPNGIVISNNEVHLNLF